MPRRALGPAILVAAVVVGTWLVSGVSLYDIVRFIAYELGFVAVPGGALLWAIRGRRPSLLVAIGLGWPLGQTIEILAFSATAATGVRVAFILYPLVVLGASAAIVWRRSREPQTPSNPDPTPGMPLWVAAAALSLGLTYLALLFLPTVPLPSTTAPVSYNADFPFFIGLIAQVLHHWPTTSPGLSGSPLHYEWFVFFHMAAVAQVTSLPIPVIALRLDYVPTMVVIGCQLLMVGRVFGRTVWAGVVAIAIFFLLGPLDLTTDSGGRSSFFDLFSAHLLASWTFPFGLMFFLGLLYLISERVQAPTWRRGSDLRSWVLIALLMIGASGAKATILPVIIAGAGLYGLVTMLSRRTIPMNVVVTVGLGVVIFAVTFYVVYGGGVPGTTIEPLVALGQTAPVTIARGISGHTLRTIALPIAYVAGLAGMLLPLAGALYIFRRPHRREVSRTALCLCMFGAGLLITSVVHQVGYSELYFQDTGDVAAIIVAAIGLHLAWVDAGHAFPASRRVLCAAFIAWLLLLIGVVAATSRVLPHPDALVARYVGLAAGGALFVVAAALVLRAQRSSRSGILALGLIPLLAASALTSPVDVAPAVHRVLTGVPITPPKADPGLVWGLTPGLLSALQWLRDHSQPHAVVAVNNHWIDPAKKDGRNYYYSAFSERSVFIEGYDSIRYGISASATTPAARNFAARQRLNDAVFNGADAAALHVLTSQYGVRFLFIDRVHGGADPAVIRLGRVVFSSPDAAIVAV